MGVSGMPDPYKNVDPNGLQTGSTTSTAVGLGLIATSEGGTVASALGIGAASAKVATAGISLAALGNVSLFSAGLVLVALGIILNVISLVVRWQRAREDEATVEAFFKDSYDLRPPGPPTGPRIG